MFLTFEQSSLYSMLTSIRKPDPLESLRNLLAIWWVSLKDLWMPSSLWPSFALSSDPWLPCIDRTATESPNGARENCTVEVAAEDSFTSYSYDSSLDPAYGTLSESFFVAASDLLRDCTTCNLKGMASLGWPSWFYSTTTSAQVCCPIGAAVVDPGWCCLLH